MNAITSLITQTIELDQGVERPIALKQHLVYANASAHTFRLLCMRNGQPVSLHGMQCFGTVRRKDGVTIPLDGSIAGHAASITLSAPCYAVPGSVTISMELVSGECRATHGLWVAQVECPVTDQVGGEAATAISDALERLKLAARPNWEQSSENMPDHILNRTHYRERTTADCTVNLGVTNGWQKVSEKYCPEALVHTTYLPRAFATQEGTTSELELGWKPEEYYAGLDEQGRPTGGWRKTYGVIPDPTSAFSQAGKK